MKTKVISEAYTRFNEATETILNPEISKWKKQGGKVIGYFCSAFPKEIVTAAGMIPFRIRATGSKGTELSDSLLSNINCTFVRHAFNMALSGEYDFLDGLAMFNSCDNIRRVYDHWIRQLNTPFTHFMSLPKKAGPAQIKFFRGELATFKQHMEDQFSLKITDNQLRDAIKLHNESRKLLRQLYGYRKNEHPPITGARTLAVTVAGTALPAELYNRSLCTLLDEIQAADKADGYRARLMLIGSVLDNPGYIDVIEGQGGLVVTDSLCFGSRNFWIDIDESIDDPLTALAQYYVVDRPSCPRTFDMHERRAEYIKDMIDRFKVDGVIMERLTFCDVWGCEQFPLTNDFKKWGVPLLTLDREYTLGGIGQLRTRSQAFIESLGGRK